VARPPWVALLPPFHEHLLRDFGALNLGMVIVLGVSAVIMERHLVVTALVADVVLGIPHMIFHQALREGTVVFRRQVNRVPT
jgi:hypothetical protein